MSDYFHEETVKEMELENIILKHRLNELLEAARAALQLWEEDYQDYTLFKELKRAVEKAEISNL